MKFLWTVLRTFLWTLFCSKVEMFAKMVVFQQQLAVYSRRESRPRLKMRDRVFWVMISKLWPGSGWKESLVIVQPETVIRWHRRGFKLLWQWKSRRKPGRPRIDLEIRELIRKMSRENPLWGVPRIKSELALLGHDVAESTIAKYMARHRKPPSQTWRTFLKNHAADIVACDFFTVHTVTFRVFYVFVLLRHSDRRILYFNITQNPTMEWTLQQIREAFAFGRTPKYLLHDNGSVFSANFRENLARLGIKSVRTAYRSPWQNPYVERVIGTLRRECLDHMILLNEKHLRRVLDEFVEEYYNPVRPHLSLERNSPIPRKSDPPSNGRVVSTPILHGLHHRYHRVA